VFVIHRSDSHDFIIDPLDAPVILSGIKIKQLQFCFSSSEGRTISLVLLRSHEGYFFFFDLPSNALLKSSGSYL
jgi:hypothetical protein